MAVSRVRQVTELYDLGSLRLYREDLVSIATALSEAGDLQITTVGGQAATAPEDFADLPENIGSVGISAGLKPARIEPPRRRDSPWPSPPASIRVALSRSYARIELVAPDTRATGILTRVRLICDQRRRRLRSLVPPGSGRGEGVPILVLIGALVGLVPLAGAVLGLLSAPSVKHPNGTWTSADSVAAWVFGVVLVAALGFGWLASRPRVLIINAPRAERPTYWQRTRDLWWVGVATALLGSVAGYLLGRFTS